MNRITPIEVKSVLTKQAGKQRIPYDFTINPYRGCLFGCSYCYASKFVHDDDDKKAEWGHWVEYKKNAVDALQRESHKLTGSTIFFSSATDPYQPVERRLELTRALLEVLLFSFPSHLHIQTRSPMVIRDIDLFLRFGRTLAVGISIPTDSEVVRKAFEPRAPSIPRRLDAARRLKEAGIRATASIAPLLPCTPVRLARLLKPCVHRAWVGEINFYEKEGRLREIYRQHGWERYLEPSHGRNVQEALESLGLRQAHPP
ncbi:MAG TPA: radical SAM protein [Capsulimonadaceae bacterium]|nr:radical SAM protein [Capsulimonadaceae bacterium]